VRRRAPNPRDRNATCQRRPARQQRHRQAHAFASILQPCSCRVGACLSRSISIRESMRGKGG
jgi:hypothetical protein